MSKIYRNYDVDELDAQYNLRRLWSDVPDAIARRENESRKLRQEINGQLDIPYGQSEMEKLKKIYNLIELKSANFLYGLKSVGFTASNLKDEGCELSELQI